MMPEKDSKALTDNSRLEELSLDDMSQISGGISGGPKWDMSGGSKCGISGGPKWFAGSAGE